MLVLKKKQIIVICLALLVAMAGYLNWSYKDDAEETAVSENIGEIHLVSEEEAPDDFFEAARLERESSRAEAVQTLKNMIDSEGAEPSSKVLAEEKVIKMAETTDTETTIENLIRAKGYEDVIVYINEDTANAVVRAQEFSAQDATVVCEIITEQTGITAENIKVTQAQ